MEQLRELEARINESTKLSVKWSEHQSEEDKLLANTLLNSRKAASVTSGPKASGRKKIGWD